METLVQTGVNGLTLGSSYALIAVGITLIFGVLNIPHLALPHVGIVGAMVMATTMAVLGLSYWVALPVGVLAGMVVGVMTAKLVFAPLLHAPPLNAFIAAFGLMVFVESATLLIWGPMPRPVSTGADTVLVLGGVHVVLQRVVIVLLTLTALAVLAIVLKRTDIGMAMRAVAQDQYSAALVGIDRANIEMITLVIGSGLAAFSAGLAASVSFANPNIGIVLLVKAFAVVVVGGLGSVSGAVTAAFLLGLIESYGAVYGSPTLVEFYALGLLLAVLIVRPRGLFGRLESVR